MKEKKGICIYCNEVKELTKDHIPPQSFFHKPKPSNLITVPACRKCNNSFDLDDEYMYYIILMRHDVGEHKSGKLHLKKLERMFKKRNKLPFAKSIAKKTEEVDLYTPSGIYLGKTGRYLPDGERMQKFMKRITQGLYYYETNRILPTDNRFILLDYQNIMKQSEEFKKVMAPVFLELIKKEKTIIGDNVFAFNSKFIEDNEECYICLIIFFDYVRFVCVSLPTIV